MQARAAEEMVATMAKRQARYGALSIASILVVILDSVPAILAGELVTTLIYHSPAWLPVARVIVGR